MTIKLEMKLLVFIFIFIIQDCSSQIVSGIYIRDNDSLPPIPSVVESKARYIFDADHQPLNKPELFFFERYDTLGRLVEEKDFNLNGTLYSWSFLYYRNKEVLDSIVVLKLDSSLNFKKYFIYDNKDRLTDYYGVNQDGSLRFKSTFSYSKKSEIAEIWYGDSSKVSTYVSIFNNDKKVIKEKRYNGNKIDTVLKYIANLEYSDTNLISRTEQYFKEGKFDYAIKSELDSKGLLTKVYECQEWPEFILKKESDYDSCGRLIHRKEYKEGVLKREFHWVINYDSLLRPLEIVEYNDMLAGFKNKGLIKSKKVYDYLESYYGRKEIETELIYYNNELSEYKTIIKGRKYDEYGNWLSTTKTRNGILEEYLFAVYKFRE